MFAAHDQENLVHGHQQIVASKSQSQGTKGLHPKTPGNKFPKTPLKIPLNDENALGGFGGKSAKGKGLENLTIGGKQTTFDKNAFITPMAPRARAPLGAKTTNAKAKAYQTPSIAVPEKITETVQQASTRRSKKVFHPEAVKIKVHGDESPLVDRDVEYAPPRPRDLPYVSDVFPLGCLDYNPIKKGNLMKGVHESYNHKVDVDGVSRVEKRLEQGYLKSAKMADEAIQRAMEEDWVVGDVPETFRNLKKSGGSSAKTTVQNSESRATASRRAPPTIASRKAASTLCVAPKVAAPTHLQSAQTARQSFLNRGKKITPKLEPNVSSTMRHTVAAAASRSTIGYTKGRNASGALQTQKRQGGLTRSASNMSQASDVTITPARFVQTQEVTEAKKFSWLAAFEVDDEELEPGFKGMLPERRFDGEEEEEFVFSLGTAE